MAVCMDGMEVKRRSDVADAAKAIDMWTSINGMIRQF